MPRTKKILSKSLSKEIIGQNLRMVRMQKGFTQVDLAVKLDISQNGYSKIETGRTHLTIDMLARICHLYNMELEDLVAILVT